MELINRKHKDIVRQKSGGKVVVSLDEDGMYFSGAAVSLFGLKPGLFIHFMNDASEWKFIVNDDSDDFPIVSKYSARTNGLTINSRPLVRLFTKNLPYKSIPNAYYMHWGEGEINGCRIIEIMTAKPAHLIGE